MPRFRVVLSETTEYTFEVDAENAEQAKLAVENQAIPVEAAVREEMVDCHVADALAVSDREETVIFRGAPVHGSTFQEIRDETDTPTAELSDAEKADLLKALKGASA